MPRYSARSRQRVFVIQKLIGTGKMCQFGFHFGSEARCTFVTKNVGRRHDVNTEHLTRLLCSRLPWNSPTAFFLIAIVHTHIPLYHLLDDHSRWSILISLETYLLLILQIRVTGVTGMSGWYSTTDYGSPDQLLLRVRFLLSSWSMSPNFAIEA